MHMLRSSGTEPSNLRFMYMCPSVMVFLASSVSFSCEGRLMVSLASSMFVDLCYPHGTRLSIIAHCTVHEQMHNYRLRMALVQIPTQDLTSYIHKRQSPRVFLLEQEFPSLRIYNSTLPYAVIMS